MAFSEKVKTLAKQNSSFRCCICYRPFVEIHHIKPQSEGGSDDIENAAPLCASCHDLYGGNPEKRKMILQMRDHWWKLMEERRSKITENPDFSDYCSIDHDGHFEGKLRGNSIVLYHAVFENEGFEVSAKILHELIRSSQDKYPNRTRKLYVDIDGHRSESGGFDHDMYELQRHFLLGFMFQYLSELNMPLCHVKNKTQSNDVPERVDILDELNTEVINDNIDKGVDGIWLADKDKLLKL
ncbi:HNH endonuclease [Vibrio navarrensis]|uniref:HNH endonuclease n=2 Tax=Vibrionaceae TaxID=641 RepID=UPI0013022B72|nr:MULTISPECIES: HNH endonuclease signature motif containing protein [Vibrio]MBE3659132.1 HNH endonuclease [Vibrio navarrensis]